MLYIKKQCCVNSSPLSIYSQKKLILFAAKSVKESHCSVLISWLFYIKNNDRILKVNALHLVDCCNLYNLLSYPVSHLFPKATLSDRHLSIIITFHRTNPKR